MGATLGAQVPTGDMGSCRGTGGTGHLAQCKYNRLSEYLYSVKFITDLDMDTSKIKILKPQVGKTSQSYNVFGVPFTKPKHAR